MRYERLMELKGINKQAGLQKEAKPAWAKMLLKGKLGGKSVKDLAGSLDLPRANSWDPLEHERSLYLLAGRGKKNVPDHVVNAVLDRIPEGDQDFYLNAAADLLSPGRRSMRHGTLLADARAALRRPKQNLHLDPGSLHPEADLHGIRNAYLTSPNRGKPLRISTDNNAASLGGRWDAYAPDRAGKFQEITRAAPMAYTPNLHTIMFGKAADEQMRSAAMLAFRPGIRNMPEQAVALRQAGFNEDEVAKLTKDWNPFMRDAATSKLLGTDASKSPLWKLNFGELTPAQVARGARIHEGGHAITATKDYSRPELFRVVKDMHKKLLGAGYKPDIEHMFDPKLVAEYMANVEGGQTRRGALLNRMHTGPVFGHDIAAKLGNTYDDAILGAAGHAVTNYGLTSPVRVSKLKSV